MTDYTIVTDECQRILNNVGDEMFAIRSDYQHVEDDVEALRQFICGRTEFTVQAGSQRDHDKALTHYFDEVDRFFEELRTELGRVYLAMQDVLNFFVSGDAKMMHDAETSSTHAEFPYTLTRSGHGDPPPTFDTRETLKENNMTRTLGQNRSQLFLDAQWNRNAQE